MPDERPLFQLHLEPREPVAVYELNGALSSLARQYEQNQSKPWQFQPGQSGNPRCKPKGARHHATRIVEQLLGEGAKLLAEKARDMALAGDIVALRLCLERLCPPRKGRPVSLDLPAVETLGDASAAVSEVIASMVAGELTPDEAGSVVALIDAKRRVLVDVDRMRLGC